MRCRTAVTQPSQPQMPFILRQTKAHDVTLCNGNGKFYDWMCVWACVCVRRNAQHVSSQTKLKQQHILIHVPAHTHTHIDARARVTQTEKQKRKKFTFSTHSAVRISNKNQMECREWRAHARGGRKRENAKHFLKLPTFGLGPRGTITRSVLNFTGRLFCVDSLMVDPLNGFWSHYTITVDTLAPPPHPSIVASMCNRLGHRRKIRNKIASSLPSPATSNRAKSS